MEANDGSNEWDAIMSAHEKEDEIRRMTVQFLRFSDKSYHRCGCHSSCVKPDLLRLS